MITLGMLQSLSIKYYVKIVAYLAALYIVWPGISRVHFDALLVIIMSISYDLNPFSYQGVLVESVSRSMIIKLIKIVYKGSSGIWIG
jgi:hypothetical protein